MIVYLRCSQLFFSCLQRVKNCLSLSRFCLYSNTTCILVFLRPSVDLKIQKALIRFKIQNYQRIQTRDIKIIANNCHLTILFSFACTYYRLFADLFLFVSLSFSLSLTLTLGLLCFCFCLFGNFLVLIESLFEIVRCNLSSKDKGQGSSYLIFSFSIYDNIK